ncbi:MAG: M20 aminoacylase family protein [Planctomycetota bacterium]
MKTLPEIRAFNADLVAWRRDFHMHPELGYEEVRTSGLVAERLASWGIEVHKGLGRTGVVGVLKGRETGGTIGIRADMDALPMEEEGDVAHKSTVKGKFHGCGHDGHTTMLLGAARHLAAKRDFKGTVHFIFQPAEEGLAGGKAMVEEGLFERFPCDEVYGLHNWPELPYGQAVAMAGPIMAASDFFDVEITGVGAHAAMPHRGVDPIHVAAHVITALQGLVSRQTNPLDSAVISVTKVEAGSAYNVIPERAILRGTCRTLRPETRDAMEAGIARVAENVAKAFGARAVADFRRNYPPTVNHAPQSETFARAAEAVVGAGNVLRDAQPSMGGEDFAFMLEKRPGCYLWLGAGGAPTACNVHHPRYDFNDDLLPVGASLWVELVHTVLGRAQAS